VWSPDGRSLAFVTDRFTTDLDALTSGSLRLATIDVASGAIQPVAAFSTGKHLAPQWSRDGRSLYFISDGRGAPDVYALDLTDGAIARLTEADSGVAGLTASSPALSIAAAADVAAVTVYESGTFAVHNLALTGPLGLCAGFCGVDGRPTLGTRRRRSPRS
jgi:dipeptidyl aminopeptidase/acylaminoacyl peptidase